MRAAFEVRCDPAGRNRRQLSYEGLSSAGEAAVGRMETDVRCTGGMWGMRVARIWVFRSCCSAVYAGRPGAESDPCAAL